MHAAPVTRWTNGHAVAAARHHAGLTQTELAARVHTSKVTISHVESGKYEAGAALLHRIAVALEVDPGPLLRHIDSNTADSGVALLGHLATGLGLNPGPFIRTADEVHAATSLLAGPTAAA